MPGTDVGADDVGIREKPSVLGKRRPLRHHDQHTAGVHKLQLGTQKPCVLRRLAEQHRHAAEISRRGDQRDAHRLPRTLSDEKFAASR